MLLVSTIISMLILNSLEKEVAEKAETIEITMSQSAGNTNLLCNMRYTYCLLNA